jgi:hypothetical protein
LLRQSGSTLAHSDLARPDMLIAENLTRRMSGSAAAVVGFQERSACAVLQARQGSGFSGGGSLKGLSSWSLGVSTGLTISVELKNALNPLHLKHCRTGRSSAVHRPALSGNHGIVRSGGKTDM